MKKKAQISIFVIIAIIIIALALFLNFFVFKEKERRLPEAEKAEIAFSQCAALILKEGIKLLGFHGGWIYPPEFETGSEYMPFSNYFFFLGTQIPYWYYISGNKIEKWQIVSKDEIEKQLAIFVKEKIEECKPQIENVEISFHGMPETNVKIYERYISLEISWPMQITKNDRTLIIEKHKTNVKSNLNKLYHDALKIFEAENSTFFLENYSIDILNLYAPTTRIELECTPKAWTKDKVFDDIKNALEANIPMIKFKGNYYKLKKNEHKYFVVDLLVESKVNLLYSKEWPTKIDIWPSENGFLKTYPIGNQPGLGTLGFCINTYHFVYDLAFPVLFQIYEGEEIFQFPVIVYIEKNRARKAETEKVPSFPFEICKSKTQTGTVFTYDQNSVPVEAEIFFKCFDQVCRIGRTTLQEGKARLTEKFPECINGLLIARAEGFEDALALVSSNEPFVQNMFLEKSHELEVELELQANERAIINFQNDKKISVFYPDQRKVSITPKTYNLSVLLFKETSLNLEKQKGEKCITLPSGGLGIPFAPRRECIEIEIPETLITEAPFGGGSSVIYFSEQELNKAKKLKIKAERFFVPSNLEELTQIYELIEWAKLNITLEK
ncbi:MAG: hypothetical protein NZ889_01070 [Candidatus Pacearchaeota archaeon]|nr:hypothetical protein [Candidatus Pacearchaeota archaeon]